MTDRIIGAYGVHDLDCLYIIPWSVRILRFLSVGWSCRLTPLVACSSPHHFGVCCAFSASFSRLFLSILQHRRLVEFVTKVRTFLIEVDLYSRPIVLCSTIVCTQQPLDNCGYLGYVQYPTTTSIWLIRNLPSYFSCGNYFDQVFS
jgi:hypothetical protein